jgi:hypothetical protein
MVLGLHWRPNRANFWEILKEIIANFENLKKQLRSIFVKKFKKHKNPF